MKTGQWYHGSMAKPVTLDMDMGSDASSIKTDSSSVSDKRYSESGPGVAKTLPPDTAGGGMYAAGAAQASPMGGPAGYDPMRSLPPGSNVAMGGGGGEFGARPTPNGALGQMTVDPSSGRNLVDQNGRMMAEAGGPRQATDASGRPLYDAAGKPLLDQTARPMLVDSGGRPIAVDSSGRPIVDQAAGGRGVPLEHRPAGVDATGRPVVDQSAARTQPPPAADLAAGRPLLDSTGRPLLDFAGNPIIDYSGRQLPTDTRPTTDSTTGRPAAYPDPSVGRPPAVDQSGRPMLDQTGRPVMEYPGGAGRPVTDAAGRPLPPESGGARQPTDQSGRPLPPDHALMRGTNDFGYATSSSTERGGASQPKLDPAGRPMFDASGRMILEPVPPLHVEQAHQPLPVDAAAAKLIVDPHLGPIGDIHRGRSAPLDSSAAQQRFDVHGRPLPAADVHVGPDGLRRPAAADQRPGMEASLSATGVMTSESRGRMLPDIESRAAGGPSVQDWRGADASSRPVGPDVPWPKDRAPPLTQEPLQGVVGQRGIVDVEPGAAAGAAWQGTVSDPAITSAQQRQPPRHVPGEPWRQQPAGPHRYAHSICCVVS